MNNNLPNTTYTTYTNNTSSIEPAATQPVTHRRAGNAVIQPRFINNVPPMLL